MFNCVKFAFLSFHRLFQDIIITLYCSGYVPSSMSGSGRLDLLGGGGWGGQRAAKEQAARGVRGHAPPEAL